MKTNLKDDTLWMDRSIQEAHFDERKPALAVGAVITKNGREIAVGHGIHRRNITSNYFSNHAEYMAIRAARLSGKSLVGATLYTILEPCTYESRSPGTHSCVDEIIESGISKVVFGIEDPNPYVHAREKFAQRSIPCCQISNKNVIARINEL